MANVYDVTIDGQTYQVTSDSPLSDIEAYNQVQSVIAQPEKVQQVPDISGYQNQIMQLPDGSRIMQDVDAGKVAIIGPEGQINDDQQMAMSVLNEAMNRTRQIGLAEQAPFTAGVAKTLGSIPYVGEGIDELAGQLGIADPQYIRDLKRGVEEGYPIPSAVAKTAGIGTGVVGASRLPVMRTSSIPEAAVKYGATGGAFGASEGGVSGYLGGTGGPTDPSRIQGATEGAKWGAIFGVPLGVAGGAGQQFVSQRGVEGLGKKIADQLGVSPEAGTIIAQSLNLNSTLDEAVNNIRRAGTMGMIADADIATARLLASASNLGSPQAARAAQVVPERSKAQSENLVTYMDEALGEAPVGTQTVMGQAYQRTAAPRARAYDEAFSTPIDYASPSGISLENALNRVGAIEPTLMRQAIEEANKEMMTAKTRNLQIMADIAEDGTVTFREMPNLRQVDELKKALQSISEQQIDKVGRQTQAGRRYAQLATEVRDAAVEAVPSYANALRLGQSTIREADALAQSGALLRRATSVEDVIGLVKGADQPTSDALRTALRLEIDNMMGEVRTSFLQGGDAAIKQANKVLTELFAPNNVKKMKLILGDEGYAALRPKMDEVASALQLQGQVREGSQTAGRQQFAQNVEDVARGGVVETLKRGEVPGTLKGLIQTITGATDVAYADKQNELLGEIVRALTEKRGKDAEAALIYIQEALQGAPITEAKQAFIANTARRALVGAGREQAPITGQE